MRMILSYVIAPFVAVMIASLLPSWSLYLLTIALAKSLVVLGLVLLFRCGLVSFGHGLFYCTGAYTPGILGRWLGISDVFLSLAAGLLVTILLGAMLGVFLARYRGVFFAMFNLALSMILYGALLKFQLLGGSDGLRILRPSGLDIVAAGGSETYRIFILAAVIVAAGCVFADRYFRSILGLRSQGVADNEIRIDYLGGSAWSTVLINYVISAALAGTGGVLSALATGYVTPELTYWTVSGEFVFITVLAGATNVWAAPLATLLFESVRLAAGQLVPHFWQMILGTFLLLTIVFLPGGLSGCFRPSRRPAVAKQAASDFNHPIGTADVHDTGDK